MSESLRISRVTFFTHGLACLEHTATVQGDTRHMLSIKPSAMADLLKTLTVHPGSGGIVKSVSYDAPPSLDGTANFAVDHDVRKYKFPCPKTIPSGNVITELLNEHIGSPVTVFHDKGSVTGRVMGLQHLQNGATETMSTAVLAPPVTGSGEDAVVLLQDDGLMVPVRLSHLQGVRMNGPKGEDVAARFRRAAERGRIGVTIVTKGDDERKLTVKYAVEAPVYKVTYRVVLLDENNLYIQAWAIVDNPSDERLDDVEVVMISGLPISFRHDVYQARSISRPVEPVSKHAGIAAGACDATASAIGTAIGTHALTELLGSSERPPFRSRLRRHERHELAAQCAPSADEIRHLRSLNRNEETEQVQLQSEMTPQWGDAAEASAVGSVHEYRIPGRVTIPAHESALLPLIMTTTPGGQVDMYVHHIRSTNTLRAVKIVNNTTAPFERGPVAVYDEDTLVGEGMLPSCQPGVDVLMPYSVNLKCKVDKRETRGKGGFVKECFQLCGQFVLKRYYEKVTVYDFSRQSKALTVVVVHDCEKGLIDKVYGEQMPTTDVSDNTSKRTKIMAEKEEGHSRHFRVTIEAETKTSLRVIESQLVTSTYNESDIFNRGIFASITHEGLAGKDALDRIRRYSEVRREVDHVTGSIRVLTEEGRTLEDTQQRYRENIKALGGEQGRTRNSGAVTEYVQRIRESEARIEEIKLEIEEKKILEGKVRTKFAEVFSEFEVRENTEDGEDHPMV